MGAETAFAIGFIFLCGMVFLLALGSLVGKVGTVLERLIVAYRGKGRMKQ